MVTGEPGSGKSVALRLLAARLGALRDVVVGRIEHPQSRLSDFYRELGAERVNAFETAGMRFL